MRNDDGKNVSIKDAHYDNYSKRRHNFDVKKAIYFTYKGLKGCFQGGNYRSIRFHNFFSLKLAATQGLVKGAILCYRNLYFYFQHGESTSTASQLTSPSSQKSQDINKFSLLLQNLDTSQ